MTRSSVATVVTVLAGFLVPTLSLAETIFTDDFDESPSPLWGNEIGGWYVHDGVYDTEAPDNSPPTLSSLPMQMADYAIDVDVLNLYDGGIYMRANSDFSEYVLLITGGYDSSHDGLYWHVRGGPPEGIVSGLGIQGSDVHLRVEVVGDTFSAYLNGSTEPATFVHAPGFASGRTGLYDYSSYQTFDNVVVETFDTAGSIPPPEQTTRMLVVEGANPIRESSSIVLQAIPGSATSLNVFDAHGRLVRELWNGYASGPVRLHWDGSDQEGRRVSSGVYFCRAESSLRGVRSEDRVKLVVVR